MVTEQKEKNILWLSFLAGLVLAVAEFFYAIFSHSQSVLMDAVYDTTELVFIILILFLTPLFYKPVSEKHPYGFFQVESIFMVIKGFMMISVTLGVCADVIESAISGGNPVNEEQISFFQLVQGLVCMVIYLIMKKMNRSVSSPTVDAELLEWKLDISYSGGLALAFFASSLLEHTAFGVLAPYCDSIIAVVVMGMMLPQSVKILWDAIKDVFLFPPDEETVEGIKAICAEILEPTRISPVSVDVIRTGRHLWVAVYYTTDEDTLPVQAVRMVTSLVNQRVADTYENCSCELILSPENPS